MAAVSKKIVHTVFEATADRFPERTAVRQGGRSVSYRDLSRASDAIAARLRGCGAGRNSLCGVAIESGAAYVAAILGVMKVGATFVPLDLSLPAARLRSILRKTPPALVLVAAAGRLAALGVDPRGVPSVLVGDDLQPTPGQRDGDRPGTAGAPPDPDAGCYIMYTSGSTGVPKAIEGCYKGLSHFVHWEVGEFGFDERIRVSQLAPVAFDASLRDIFVPLITGGCVCIPAPAARADARALLDWMEAEEITLVHCVPSLLRALTRELEGRVAANSGAVLPALQQVLVAGEPLYGKDVIRWWDLVGERVGLTNLYGPSETTLVKTCHRIRERPGNPAAMIPIGRPIANTAVLIVKGDRLCEPGEIGDIVIKTPFRAKGYYGDPDLTRESFVPNPLTGDPEDVVYRTGDLGRYLADWSVEFIGRLDTQVKVNGIRVELGEIERVLRGSAWIDEAVVTAPRSPTGETGLVCYYTEKQSTDAGQLSAWLREALPSAMVPSYYVRLEEFPLTLTGKIDRKALPKPEEMLYQETPYEAPADERERALAAIWGEVLHLKRVGVNSPFFQIGGHSLSATRVLGRIYREMGVEVSLRDFFAHPTIRQLAPLLARSTYAARARIVPCEPQADYRLAPPQRRLWILDRMEEGSVAYSLPGLWWVEGGLDLPALEQAFAALIARHESLRTTFAEDERGPRQRVHPAEAVAFRLERVDLSAEGDPEKSALGYARRQAAIPFDLGRGPLLRVAVLALAGGRSALFCNMHHIVGDAWSLDILGRELLALYEASRAGRPNPLPPLPLQYRDYAAWINARQAEPLAAARYWHEKLAGDAVPLNLPWDSPRPPLMTYRGETCGFTLDARLATGLAEIARRHDTSLFVLLLALLKTLLHRYSGQEQITVGSPVAGRTHPDLDDQIGLYANTLALRDRLDPAEPFVALLAKVGRTVLEAYDHQEYPFDRLVDELQPARDPGRAPLFDVMLVFRETEDAPLRQGELRLTPVEADWGTSRFDLTFEVEPTPDSLRIAITYNPDLFRAATIERMTSHVIRLAESVVADPSVAVGRLEFLPPAEKRLVTEAWNATYRPYPADRTIVDLFGLQAARWPDRPAVLMADKQVSYRELEQRSRALARTLVAEHGVAPQQVVGLMVGRGEWSLVGLLGILMAGGVYLPVDPELPAERIGYLLEDAGCQLLLVQGDAAVAAGSTPGSARVAAVDRAADSPEAAAVSLAGRSSPDAPAYLIYTSGSTGRPKGVLIAHRGFVNMVLDQIRVFGVSEQDRVAQFAPASFDASLSEIFMGLLAGAAVVPVPKATIDDPLAFVQFLAEKHVSHVTLPPAYLAALDADALTTVTTIITAGEPPIREDAVRLSGRTRYFNAYGPTECAVCATIAQVVPDGDYPRGIPIGRPIANTQVLILDRWLNAVPIGVPGEICLSGPGLALGYHNRAEATAERFLPHPAAVTGRLYRSGDLGRWRADGSIEWLGRGDDQVKIRGHRIELGEIQAAVLGHDAVTAAAVTAVGASGELAAYFTAAGSVPLADLCAHLRRWLPPYMVPAHLVRLDALPLTAHGKVDRRALPDPRAVAPEAPPEGPVDEGERRLLDLWREVLERPTLGRHENFFEAGGNSLRALQLISRMASRLGLTVPVKQLFVHPTAAALAAALAREAPPLPPAAAPAIVSPALQITRRPLLPRLERGEIGPVDAAAIVCLPDDLRGRAGLERRAVVEGFCGGQPVLSSVATTCLGRVASIVLPRFGAELFDDQETLRTEVREALALAGRIGADMVALTGGLPTATGLGFGMEGDGLDVGGGPAVTTGQATVAAAMVMTVERLLADAGRGLEGETVGLLGLGTIGPAAVSLLLAQFPHPHRIILADADSRLLYAAVLSRELADAGFRGTVEVLRAAARLPERFYQASLILAATSVPELVEVERVRPGTIAVVEESGQRCVAPDAAARRTAQAADVLFADGDRLRMPSPASCLLYLPEEAERALRHAGALGSLAFDPWVMPGCVLSGLLARGSTLVGPTLGEVDGETCLRHYRRLRELGFAVAAPQYDGRPVGAESVRRLRARFGTAAVTA